MANANPKANDSHRSLNPDANRAPTNQDLRDGGGRGGHTEPENSRKLVMLVPSEPTAQEEEEEEEGAKAAAVQGIKLRF